MHYYLATIELTFDCKKSNKYAYASVIYHTVYFVIHTLTFPDLELRGISAITV